MSDRFYCPEPPIDGRITLEGDEARHLSRVRRLTAGDRVEVFDGRGTAVLADVAVVHRDRVELRVVVAAPPLADRRPPLELTLATAVPKGERFDWLVEKATELGVSRLVPILTERSAVDPRDAKLDRLRRVIVEASKQCGRNRLMALEGPVPWPALLERADARFRWLAHPGGIGAGSWSRPGPGEAVLLAIGPEGGFTTAEVEAARGRGWDVIGLGETLLRIETAGLVGCARILALCD